MNGTTVFLFAAALVAGVACADYNYYVVPPGTPGVPENPDYLSWETAGTNLHDAVYLANGQHVGKSQKDWQHNLFVKSGTYVLTSQLEFGDCKTTMRSSKGPGATWELDREGTILCGGYPASTNRLISMAFGSVSRAGIIRGFTITNGVVVNSSGGGILASGFNRTDTGIYDCTVVDCRAIFGSGGGIYFCQANYAPGIISNCWVTGCVASNKFEKDIYWGGAGGGIVIGMYGSANFMTSSRTEGIRMFDTVVSNNVIYGNSILGSGMRVSNTGVWIEGCTFVTNRAYCLKNGNQSNGAAVIGANTRSKLINCQIDDNYCENSNCGSGASFGAGSIISNCVFRNNRGGSGGILTLGSAEAQYNGGKVVYTSSVVCVNCMIDGNGGSGVGAINSGWRCKVRNCLITGCTGYSGQTAPIVMGETWLENLTIVGNSKGIFCYDGAYSPCLVNSILDNDRNVHQATRTGSNVGVIFSNCWISARSTTTQPKYNCLTFASDQAKFVDAAAGDYHLQKKSPLRDKALRLDWMTDAGDKDEKPRCLDKRGKETAGALPDIGCYECDAPRPGAALVVR